MKQTLKSYILDNLMASKILSYSEIVELADGYRAKTSSVERLFREKNGYDLPIKKLNRFKKPCKEGETIYYYKWLGFTKLNKYARSK